jgi:hypothetical protein
MVGGEGGTERGGKKGKEKVEEKRGAKVEWDNKETVAFW